MSHILILSTCTNVVEAKKIAKAIVEKKLAACVNIVPVHSVFRWKGSIEESDEQLLVVKTSSKLFEKVSECVKKLHSYELPEVISLEIRQGSKPYLKWIQDSIREN